MSILPEIPPPPGASLVLFSTQQWNWLTSVLLALRAGQEAEMQVLGALVNGMETIMATQAELQAALDELGTTLTEALADIDREIEQLSTSTPPSQAQIDQLRAASASLREASARLKADDPAAPPTP